MKFDCYYYEEYENYVDFRKNNLTKAKESFNDAGIRLAILELKYKEEIEMVERLGINYYEKD